MKQSFYRFPDSDNSGSKLTETEEEKVKNFRKSIELLWDKYKEKRKLYEDAKIEYNNVRRKALDSKESKDINDFAINAGIYYERVKAAERDWIVEGHKNEIESMQAFIDQVTKRSANK